MPNERVCGSVQCITIGCTQVGLVRLRHERAYPPRSLAAFSAHFFIPNEMNRGLDSSSICCGGQSSGSMGGVALSVTQATRGGSCLFTRRLGCRSGAHRDSSLLDLIWVSQRLCLFHDRKLRGWSSTRATATRAAATATTDLSRAPNQRPWPCRNPRALPTLGWRS